MHHAFSGTKEQDTTRKNETAGWQSVGKVGLKSKSRLDFRGDGIRSIKSLCWSTKQQQLSCLSEFPCLQPVLPKNSACLSGRQVGISAAARVSLSEQSCLLAVCKSTRLLPSLAHPTSRSVRRAALPRSRVLPPRGRAHRTPSAT